MEETITCPFCWPHDIGFLDKAKKTFTCTHCGTNLNKSTITRAFMDRAEAHLDEAERLQVIFRELMKE